MSGNCYLLTAVCGDVKLERPSTSRTTIMNAIGVLLYTTPKGMDWKITLETADLTPEDFKAKKEAFDEDLISETMALSAQAELAEHPAEEQQEGGD